MIFVEYIERERSMPWEIFRKLGGQDWSGSDRIVATGQVGAASFLDNFPTVKDEDAVRDLHRRKSVRDHDRRFSACEDLQRIHQLGFGHGIEPAGRLIHDENGRVTKKGPGQRDALALPS